MSVSPVSTVFHGYTARDVLQPHTGMAVHNPQLEKEQKEKTQKVEQSTEQEAAQNHPRETDDKGDKTPSVELTEEEQRQLEELKARDREVRAHEAAHRAVGGQHVRGGISYSYQTGPDGNQYAIGGEVSIDASPVPGDPQATLQKAEQVRQAALAPADPSAQDRAVAAQATQMSAEARAEIQQQKAAELKAKQAPDDADADAASPRVSDNSSDNAQVAQYQAVATMKSDDSTEAALDFIA